jgi:hypothetical protein
MNRRNFLTAAAAVAIVPLPKEAPCVKCVEVFQDGQWKHVPSGLRQVVIGQRFRMHVAPEPDSLLEPYLQDVIMDRPPFTTMDADGYTCGGCTVALHHD